MSTTTWTGTVSDDSQNADNWGSGLVPQAGTVALIDVATAGIVTEPFGENFVSFPVDGPVYYGDTLATQVFALDGGAGAPPPEIDFVPFNSDQTMGFGTGVAIAEIGGSGNVDFLAANPGSAVFDFAGVMTSDTAGGILNINAQSDSLIFGTVDLDGYIEASSGGTIDLTPPAASIVATDTLGNTTTLAPDLVVNDGVIAANAGGVVLLDPDNGGFINAGSIVAAGGTVLVDTAISESNSLLTEGGSGSLYIAGGVIDLVTSDRLASEYVTFTAAGTLVLASDGGQLATVDGITGFAAGDTLDLPGNAISDLAYDGATLSYVRTTGGESFAGKIALAGAIPAQGFVVTPDGSGITVACFARGTCLRTEDGPVAVERLAVGQMLVTASGARRPVRWLGHRRIACGRHPDPAQIWPVRIAAQAFGIGRPRRDLFLSPDHAVFDQGILVPIRALINGTTILRQPVDEIEYWHVELDRHDIVLAEGLAAESYLDTQNRHAFAGAGIVTMLHPHFQPGADADLIWEAAGCAPLRVTGAAFDRLVRKLERRAVVLGHAERPRARRRRAMATPVSDLARLLRPRWYRATYPDVAASGIDPATHYARWGRAEGRLPCPEADLLRGLGLIDPGLLAFVMLDLVMAGLEPEVHFCTHGWREGRRPNCYFDGAWYRARHHLPDTTNPLLHYVLSGEGRGLQPSRHFDPSWYRRRYGLSMTQSPLAHFLANRRSQCFAPHADFDLAACLADPKCRMLPGRDPYAYHLVTGGAEIGSRMGTRPAGRVRQTTR